MYQVPGVLRQLEATVRVAKKLGLTRETKMQGFNEYQQKAAETTMTHFIHMRYTTPVNRTDGLSYEIDGRGGLTIAYKVDHEDNAIVIGYAKCSRRDLYNKKKGRAIAEGRMNSKHYKHIVKFPDEEVLNKLLLDRNGIQDYVFGAMTQILPEEALPDYYELVTR
jgi:hypothetical protein